MSTVAGVQCRGLPVIVSFPRVIILSLSHPLREPGAAGGNYLLMEIALNWLSSRESKEQQPLQITLFLAETPVVRPSGLGLCPRSWAGWERMLATVVH